VTQSGPGDERRYPAARPEQEGVALPADGSGPWGPGVPAPFNGPVGGQPWGAPALPQQTPGEPGQGIPAGAPAEALHGAPPPPYRPPHESPYPQHQQYGGGLPPDRSFGGVPSQPRADAGPPPAAAYPAGPEAAAGPGPVPLVPSQPGPPPGYPAAGAAGAHDETRYIPPVTADPSLPQLQVSLHGVHTDTDAGIAAGIGYAADTPPPGALPGLPGQPAHSPYGAGPPGPAGAEDATRFIPPVPADGPPPGHPGAPGGALDATTVIPPVTGPPGALPPERPAESTTFLGTGPLARRGGSPEADTRFLPPVPAAGPPPGHSAPPAGTHGAGLADFDGLFRDETAAGGRPGAGQQPYRGAGHGHPAPAAPRRPYDRARAASEERRKKNSQLAVMGAVVVACAVLGLGLGAAFVAGDDEEPDNSTTTVATTPGPGGTAPVNAPSTDDSQGAEGGEDEDAAADPVRTQAEALDKLLADSNDSREAVIRSVENTRRCQNLGRAAADLRGAAGQRRGLVTRLGGVAVDKLPRSQELTAALTRAWQASAAADDHYAAWADQVAAKGCDGGRARTTGRTAQGNRASGEATRAKREAAGLWNAIARKHNLTERGPEQL
jgi:hypothetical protein